MPICHHIVRRNKLDRLITQIRRHSRALSTNGNDSDITRDVLRTKLLTLLHKTEGLLAKVAPLSSNYLECSKTALTRTYEDVNSMGKGVERKRQIVGERAGYDRN